MNMPLLEKSLNLRFWLALVAQTTLILAIPVQAVYTQVTGKTIALQTGPVDPYNPLQGYYMVLSYEVSNPTTLKNLPGWDHVLSPAAEQAEQSTPPSLFVEGREFYVVLQAPQNAADQPPQPWQPVAVSNDRPQSLSSNQVALRGIYRRGQVSYGLETYYIPEDQQIAINNDLQQAQSTDRSTFVVEAKVAPDGQALPLNFWLGQHKYQF